MPGAEVAVNEPEPSEIDDTSHLRKPVFDHRWVDPDSPLV